MRRLEFTNAAIADLTDIAEHSNFVFGRNQTFRYLEDFDTAFDHICAFPETAKTVIVLGNTLCVYRVGRHYIYFTFDEHTLIVARIIHASRDQMKALRAAND